VQVDTDYQGPSTTSPFVKTPTLDDGHYDSRCLLHIKRRLIRFVLWILERQMVLNLEGALTSLKDQRQRTFSVNLDCIQSGLPQSFRISVEALD
jgi:hypothetical protein